MADADRGAGPGRDHAAGPEPDELAGAAAEALAAPTGEPALTEDALAAPTPEAATRTVVAQVAARVIALGAVVGSIAIVARHVGSGFAEWGTVTSLVALTAFALDPGVSPIVVRRITQTPDEAPVPSALVPLRLGLGLLALVVIVGIAIGLRGVDTALLAAALGAQVVPRALVLNATPWLQVDQRLHRQAGLEAACATLGLAALAACSLLGASTPLLGLVGFTLPTTLLAVLMRRELRITPSRRFDVPGPQAERVRSVVREVAPLALALLITASYTRTFVIFLNASDESDAVTGNFLFAFQFVEQLIVAAGIVAGAVLPLLAARARIARLLEDDVSQRLLVAVAAVGGLLATAMIAAAHPLTRIIGGPDQEGAGRFLQLLAPMAPVILPAMVLAYVYVAIGQSRRYLLFTGLGLAANLVANAALTLHHGAGASARITWATEALVLVLPLGSVALANASGRAAALRIVALVAACVVCAELAAAGTLPDVVAAVLLAVAVAAVAGGPLLWLLDTMGLPVRRRTPAA